MSTYEEFMIILTTVLVIIEILDMKNKKYNDLSLNDQYLSLVFSTNKYVYCFVNSLNKEFIYSTLQIYDHNLQPIKNIDITTIGNCQRKYIIYKNIILIFFTFFK